jgi:lipid-binding SYLF domain-containing protein
MKNRICSIASVVMFALLSASVAKADDELVTASKNSLDDFQRIDSSMKSLLANSPGYVVFPSVGKAGFIVGAARGKGVVYSTNQVIGKATMTQASIGAQAGGQEFAEIIFFETAAALDDFKDGKFELSADISAVAAAEGASAAAKFRKGVEVFTLPKRGLMLQAAVGGQKFKFESETLEPTGRDTDKDKKSDADKKVDPDKKN